MNRELGIWDKTHVEEPMETLECMVQPNNKTIKFDFKITLSTSKLLW